MPKVRKDRKSVKKRKHASRNRNRDDEEDDCAAILAARRARARMRASRRGGAVAGGRGAGNRNLYEPLDYIRRLEDRDQNERNRGRFPGAPPPPAPPPPPPPSGLPFVNRGAEIDARLRRFVAPANFVGDNIDIPAPPLWMPNPAYVEPAPYDREAAVDAYLRRFPPRQAAAVGDAIDPVVDENPLLRGYNQYVAEQERLNLAANQPNEYAPGRRERRAARKAATAERNAVEGMEAEDMASQEQRRQQQSNEAATVISRRFRGQLGRGIVAGIRTRNMDAQRQRDEDAAAVAAAAEQRQRDEDARAEARRITRQQQEEQARVDSNVNRVGTQLNEMYAQAARQQADLLGRSAVVREAILPVVPATAPTPSTPLGMNLELVESGQANLEQLQAKEQGVPLGLGAFFAEDARLVEYVDAQRKRERREYRESETPEERQQRKAGKKGIKEAQKALEQTVERAQSQTQNVPEKAPNKRNNREVASQDTNRQVSNVMYAGTPGVNTRPRRNPTRWSNAPAAGAGAGAGAGANLFGHENLRSTSSSNLESAGTPLREFGRSTERTSPNTPRPAVASPQELQDTISTLTGLQEEDEVPDGQPDSPFWTQDPFGGN